MQHVRTPQPHYVAGLFLERSGAYIMKALATPTEDNGWHLDPEEGEVVDWQSGSRASARDGLKFLGQIVAEYRNEISGLAVASYGPFRSLTPGDGYGAIRADTADEPLNGLKVFDYFERCLGEEWFLREDTRFQIQTDACACAVGEAHLRGARPDEVTAYLLATDGVGIGLARGRTVVANALHPEIGLLPAYIHPRDPLATQTKKRAIPMNRQGVLDFHSISQLSNNGALRRRHKLMAASGEVPYNFSEDRRESDFWDIRACYLAQACVACIVVNPPHAIVIGADVDPLGDADQRTWHFVEVFRRGWEMSGEPLLTYNEFVDGFISRPTNAPGADESARPALTGAIGLCLLAASSSIEPKQVHFLQPRGFASG